MAWPIQDNFNRADADALGAMSDAVHNWSELAGDIDIATNKAAGGGVGGNNVAVVTETHTETDYSVQAVVTSGSSGDPGVIGRCTNASNFYLLRLNNTTLELYKNVAGGYTLLDGTYAAGVASGTLKLVVEGNQISGYFDGTLRIGPVTDTAHTSGKPGIRSYYGVAGANIWDNFIADLLAAAGGPPAGSWMMMGVGV